VTGYDDAGIDDDELPARLWFRDLEKRAGVAASIIQESTFDPESGEVVDSPVVLSMWISDDDPARFESAERARQVARAILAAADDFEQLLVEGA
jgi:hypothetical protein